jgi:hypothetical protein
VIRYGSTVGSNNISSTGHETLSSHA